MLKLKLEEINKLYYNAKKYRHLNITIFFLWIHLSTFNFIINQFTDTYKFIDEF